MKAVSKRDLEAAQTLVSLTEIFENNVKQALRREDLTLLDLMSLEDVCDLEDATSVNTGPSLYQPEDAEMALRKLKVADLTARTVQWSWRGREAASFMPESAATRANIELCGKYDLHDLKNTLVRKMAGGPA